MWGASIESVKTPTCGFLLDQLTSLEKLSSNITKGLENTLREASENIFSPKLAKLTNGLEKNQRKPSPRLGLF